MADFTEYGVPSAEWLALVPSLPQIPDLTAEQLRDLSNETREKTSAKAMVEEGLSSKVQIHDYTVSSRDGATLEARTYRPADIPISQPLPLYIHLHGGGYLFGTLSSEDAICSRIVVSNQEKGTPVAVFQVNYRHTPVYKYPTAWNDVEDAFIWVHEHIAEIGALADQIVVGGISAGGQLSASLALAQLYGENKRLATLPKLRGQILMIPCLTFTPYYEPRTAMLSSPELSSLVQCIEAPILPMSRLQFFGDLLGLENTEGAGRDIRMNPGNATADEVKKLPPTVFGIAGLDPLRDEGLFYAKLLSENGVPTDTTIFRGVPHGFRRYGSSLERASKLWDETVSNGITWALSNPPAGAFEIKTD
ncbi:hypothetical protein N7456_012905 [Penicillium angulare]|uniref:Alpha/beta hydrolase fold-3 domain-containing protein n=1 Tax=Penicillium angulare TaxID=116970 RepID=A0A9W9EKF1_9EURO|nr:hypothetical protein N7456_012905 [Penicillium angulare]